MNFFCQKIKKWGFLLVVFCAAIPHQAKSSKMEVLIEGNNVRRWDEQQEKSIRSAGRICDVPVPDRDQIKKILSDPSAREEETRKIKEILEDGKTDSVVRLRNTDGIRTNEDREALQEWENVLWSPVGKKAGIVTDWDHILVRSLENITLRGESPSNLAQKLKDGLNNKDLFKELQETTLFSLFYSAGVSGSLLSPDNMKVYKKEGIILKASSENILGTGNEDLFTPYPDAMTYLHGYHHATGKDKSIYKILNRGVLPLAQMKPSPRYDLYASRETTYNEVYMQPYDADTKKSIEVVGFFIKTEQRDTSHEPVHQAAKALQLPLVRFA